MNFYLGNRRSMASSSTAPAANPVKDDFPEALTYRYNDNSAWVPAAKSHEAVFSLFLSIILMWLINNWRGDLECGLCRRPLTLQNTHIPNC